VAASPATEIHAPVVGVLYPVLSRYQQDEAMLRAIFLRVFGWTMLVCAATGAGLLVIAPDYAMLMLGRQWNGVERLIPWLALAASAACVTNTADPVFDTLGRPSWSAWLQWLRLLVLTAVIAVTALFWRSLEAMAIARLVVILGCAPLILLSIGRALRLSASDYLALAWRPIVAAAAMSILVAGLSPFMPASPGWRLILEVALGACVYCCVILSLWFLAGKPEGAEADTVSVLRAGTHWGWERAQRLLSAVL
jgi:O-antigen/teichoic acid export membrane protein